MPVGRRERAPDAFDHRPPKETEVLLPVGRLEETSDVLSASRREERTAGALCPEDVVEDIATFSHVGGIGISSLYFKKLLHAIDNRRRLSHLRQYEDIAERSLATTTRPNLQQ